MSLDISTSYITGTQINYHFICKRKLWFFSHDIHCEQESDTVKLGKLIDEHSYEREKKELEIDHAKIDWLDVRDGVPTHAEVQDSTIQSNEGMFRYAGVLHEVKKSDAFEEAHEWQVLYYLYLLKQKGVNNIIGEIDYPKQKQKVQVALTPEKEQELQQIILSVKEITSRTNAPEIEVKKSVCKKCSYFELCYS